VPPRLPVGRADAWRLTAEHLAPGKVELYRELGLDLVMGRREGSRIFDLDGERSWIDCHTNGGVFGLGHRHPGVVAALRDALDERDGIDIGNHHLVSPWRAELARRLAATTGGRLPGVVFGSSGGEAVDLAIAVCRGATGREGVVSARGGYHGHTGLSRAAGDARFREPFGPPLPGFVQVPFDDLAALDAAVGDHTAAVLLEPIPATLGMPLPSPGYLAGASRLARDRGARLIVDEVQTGLGRTGTIWAFAQEPDLVPDALVTGKGLSGGLVPITATLLAPALFAHLSAHPFAHVSTFGGSELGCVAALAVLDAVEAPGFLERVRAVGERFGHELAGAPYELRRRGLMMALAFGSGGAGIGASRRLFGRGILAPWAANDDSVLQLLPPLTATDDEVDEIVAVLRDLFG